MKRLIRLAVLMILVGTAQAQPAPTSPPEPVVAAPPRPPTPFDRGRMGLSFGFGSQSVLGEHYYVVGGSFSYYVLDGLALDLGGSHQFGSGPSISRLTPGLRYVAQPLVGEWPLIPYVGVFASHYFIYEGIADENTVGARSGLLYVSRNLLLGLGIAVEHVVSECSMDCTTYYPDITLGLSL